MDLGDCGVSEQIETFLVSLAPQGGRNGLGDHAGRFEGQGDEGRKKNQ